MLSCYVNKMVRMSCCIYGDSFFVCETTIKTKRPQVCMERALLDLFDILFYKMCNTLVFLSDYKGERFMNL